MQWKQIKTLFILCFLILDIYLLVMLTNKEDESEFMLPETPDATFEQQLESEDITISADLPEGEFNQPYITLSRQSFTEEELAFFDDQDNQEMEVMHDNIILSRFEDPVPIPKDADSPSIQEIITDRVLLSENYTFDSWNKDMNVLVFFQKKNDRPIYYNQNGLLLVYLNDENEMIFYTQTMLGDASPREEMKSLIEPMGAIQTLFDGNRLENGDEITDVNMGLHTRLPLESGKQVFSPTWTVTVNDEENFYVNAIENQIVPSDELTFITGEVTHTIETIQNLDDNSEMADFVLRHLNQKLSSTQQSE
ncbi:Two-component signal transduction system YycFG, regulatory protein YycI [Lentibacillus halodurans]|uniref:Two-component signal transduction system YycFG, regulatory protein YycI n=1 Tax=Lentibacillus halodurans TaxID=237679 RepID=A0A1I0ZWN2_9BACI|nr:two-component system regulatory protein YycI [Lentibacillus halodurans]SFB30164.1 Two-component signal transduction system YycFG, regulatory protein YycI [Lentibacillus halodurans]